MSRLRAKIRRVTACDATRKGALLEARPLLQRHFGRDRKAREELRLILKALASLGNERLEVLIQKRKSPTGPSPDYLDAVFDLEHLIDGKLVDELLRMNTFVLARYIGIGLDVLSTMEPEERATFLQS